MLMGRSDEGGSLDHLKYLPENDNHDRLIKLVISNMRNYNWVEFYGLNFQETMGLEFHDYMMMIDSLKEYRRKIDEATPAVTDELITKLNTKKGH